MNTREEFKALFDETLTRLGGNLKVTSDELSKYAAERADKLATILSNNEPGFDQAVIAARDSVALKAGLAAGATAGAIDREWLGLIAGGLRFAAAALG
jgi:hypothetical protein